jgi:hypothetical protein
MTEASHGAVPAVDSPAPAQVEQSSEASSQPPKSEQAGDGGRTNIDKLAEKDDVTEWVEAREDAKADELGAEGRDDEIPEHKRKSRYQRLKEAKARAEAAAEAARAEAEALRQTGGIPPEEIEAVVEARLEGIRFQERTRAALKDLPDFQTVLESAPDVPLSDAAMVAIRRSEVGPRMAYELASAPEVLQALAQQPPHEQARMLGKLEALIEMERRGPQARRVTRAPAPVAPPRGGGVSPPADIRKLAESEDVTAYARERDKQTRVAGRR